MQPSMQPQMQQQMQSGFNIMFTLNGNFAGNMYVTENMMFCEVVNYFSNNYQLKEEHGATFTFNSETIKAPIKLPVFTTSIFDWSCKFN